MRGIKLFLLCLAFAGAGCSGKKNADLELAAAEKAIEDARANRAKDCAGETYRAAEAVLAEARELATRGEVDQARAKAMEAERLATQARGASPEGCDKKGDEKADLQKPSATDQAGRGATIGDVEQTIYFDFNDATIREDSKQILAQVAMMMSKDGGLKVEIEGHCDERGSTEYNLHLGERRARAVEKYLVTQGVKAGQISVISYGEERPIDSNSTEGAWARNRRAEIKRR
jgi:peptidoglycan-associated lipoprotein